MVNLTFCRLDSSYPIIFWQFRSTTCIYFHLHIPSAGCSLLLEFLLWSFKNHLVWCFPNAIVLLVICCSDFSFHNHLRFRWSWGKISWFSQIIGSWSDLLNAVGITKDFFKQPQASVQIEATWSSELFNVLLINPADSVYFCAFVLFWLEIRLITIDSICFW